MERIQDRPTKRVILASSSPRRIELLATTGLKFEVEPSRYTEEILPNSEPHDLARKNALAKAQAVAARNRDAIVIGADTLGFLEGKVLGKPRTRDEAVEMLHIMSGNCHSVVTGLSVVDSDTSRTVTESVESKVCFKKLSASQIEAYVSSGEPMDKAGAYAIQGLGSSLVDRIEGDYFNIVGLPLTVLGRILRRFDVDPRVLERIGSISPVPRF